MAPMKAERAVVDNADETDELAVAASVAARPKDHAGVADQEDEEEAMAHEEEAKGHATFSVKGSPKDKSSREAGAGGAMDMVAEENIVETENKILEQSHETSVVNRAEPMPDEDIVPGAYAVRSFREPDLEQQHDIESQVTDIHEGNEGNDEAGSGGNEAGRGTDQEGAPVSQSHLQGLAVANPVPEGPTGLPVAQQLSNKASKKWHHCCAPWKLICIAFGVAVVVAAVILVAIKSSGATSEVDHESMPIDTIRRNRAQERLQNLLPDETLDVIIQDHASAQFMAFKFLLDDPSLADYEDWRIYQRFALATFFYATGGPEWTRAPGWLSYTVHECHWFAKESYGLHQEGVFITDRPYPCEDDGTGVYQHLWQWGNGLQGYIPSELGWLTGLKSIVLYYNSLNGTIPVSVGQLTVLLGLNLAHNDLTGTLPPKILAPLQKLKYFVLSANQITGSIPTEIGLLSNLRLLLLDKNGLTGNLPETLSKCRNAKGVWLDQNELTGTIPTQLGLLSSELGYIDLSYNQITHTIPIELGNLSALKRLYLGYNAFNGTLPTELGLLNQTNVLMFQNNSLTGLLPTEIGNLLLMERFKAPNNSLSGGIPSELGQLSQMTELYLSHNTFVGTIPAIIGALSSLSEFDISQNPLVSGVLPTGLCGVHLLEFDCSGALCGCECTCNRNTTS